MTANVYIIDSSSLIELNKHNAMDVYVSVWKNISELIQNDRLIAPREVLNEIKDYDDSLAGWAKKQKKLFKAPTVKQVQIVQEILKNYPSLVDVSAKHSADPWVIALAIELASQFQQTLIQIKRIVVTEEKIRGNRIKIPYVCNQKAVECIDIVEMFRTEGWKF
ncbi:DUF4411 family protein [Candidatus Woesearchaeota archaeon]|nr:DUF4411 family protein [Candidatus Woesearchaeota archaeon]HIH48625.1 DUF4411 family protein [Candidatus Woesearchaeota archaeon]HIJ03712.1 DUF4411 family protein [Candidatus Woesearchaeota archaeon]